MEVIIIDACNVLHIPQLSHLNREEARQALLNKLCQNIKNARCIVVMDGWPSPYEVSVSRYKQIEIIYARNKSADDLIAEYCSQYKNIARVVSADREVQEFAKRFGCKISLPEAIFPEKKFKSTKNANSLGQSKDQDDYCSNFHPKSKKGPAKRSKKHRHSQPDWKL